MFFTKGVGKHREKLTSFELALRSAGIAACNLVRVSSIFPPKCRLLSRTEGMKRLEPGQVTFVVMSEAATREPHRLIAATVGVAIPRDRELYGYLSEHHSFGERRDRRRLRQGSRQMLATTLFSTSILTELGREKVCRIVGRRTSRRPPSATRGPGRTWSRLGTRRLRSFPPFSPITPSCRTLHHS
jgi:pyruvoyl-dependent arginine decarboxylase